MEVLRACRVQGRGRSRTLPFPKEAVMQQLKEIMLDSFFAIEPKFILAMRAVEELSPELKTSIVTWALGLVLGGSPGHEDPAQQVRGTPVTNTPADPASSGRLRPSFGEGCIPWGHENVSLFGSWIRGALHQQISYWLRVQWPSPRDRASTFLTHLLKDATRLPAFNTIGEDPAFGGLVAKLAVSLADPDADVREKGREVIGQFLQILLCQQGLKGEKKRRSTIRWEEDPQRPWRESYLHLTSVAEAALEDALSLARPWVREGGLVLLYTHLLLEEEEVEDLWHSLSALLYNLCWGGEVPAEIRALLPRTGNLPFLGNGGGDGAAALEPREEMKLFILLTIY
ncbi:UNVERIFIED_CONTAM: hypothetical protein K2H54_056564 [Gekko kuhli]